MPDGARSVQEHSHAGDAVNATTLDRDPAGAICDFFRKQHPLSRVVVINCLIETYVRGCANGYLFRFTRWRQHGNASFRSLAVHHAAEGFRNFQFRCSAAGAAAAAATDGHAADALLTK